LQQRATFYFINTAPQWQRFNAQNWEAVEDATRKLASNRAITVDVYTGTYGVLELDDYFGNAKEIFLYVNGADRKIPVPKLYYKVLVNKSDSTGIVLIGVNSPHLTLEEIKKDFIICTDVSDKIDYINWKKDDIGRGYSYACDVNEFLKAVPHFSIMDVKNLLI
jgi:DNA/RNA non-specific endonuclease